jgi:hypothetical protein
MKVIFLDIDGVLNSLDNMRVNTLLWKNNIGKSRDEFGHLFDERCVKWLSYIIEKTNAVIVISSTWRSSGLDKMQTMWQARGLIGEIIACTPTMVKPEIINLYAASNNEADRGYEIQQWIDDNKPERFCIIDDDSDMLNIQMPYFVRTQSDIGIDYKAANKIIAILNSVE